MNEVRLSAGLENALQKADTLDKFREHYRKICQRRQNKHKDREYANCIHQSLELALRLNDEKKNYVFLGGLAVLTHIYNSNPESVLKWRGTGDLDILTRESEISDILRRLGYKRIVGNTWGSRGGNGTSGFSTYVKENDPYHFNIQVRKDVEIDDRDITKRVYKERVELPLYGIPLTVVNIDNLLKLKRSAGRNKDRVDIKLLKTLKDRLG